jgi:RNA polymerase sigma factor (sigma-70 family)
VQGSFYKPQFGSSGVQEQSLQVVLHPDHMDDLTLWRAFRAGDEKALITIFGRFTKLMFNYGYKITGDRELVKDAIQELFIEIWQNRERLRDTDSIKYYLYKSLRRKVVRIKNRSENRLFRTFSDADNSEVSPSPEYLLIDEQISAERREKVCTMLSKLTRRKKEAIYLRYFEELTCDQIADIMQLSKQGVYNIIHHALMELKRSAGL